MIIFVKYNIYIRKKNSYSGFILGKFDNRSKSMERWLANFTTIEKNSYIK